MKAIVKILNQTTNTIDSSTLENVTDIDFWDNNGCYIVTYNNGKDKKYIPGEQIFEIDVKDADKKLQSLL